MLSVYTRHSADCPRSDDGAWKRCKCPKWVWGTLNDEFIRRSAKDEKLGTCRGVAPQS